MALGLSIQIGLIFWPISNYSTLTYLFFYLPLFTLFFLEHKRFSQLIFHTNKKVLIIFIALLSWVIISCFWSGSSDNRIEILVKTMKHNLLITAYVLGVAFLAYQSPKLLLISLISGASLVAIIALASIINQLILNDLPISSRITKFGVGNTVVVFNPVTAGIYFGMFSVLAGTFLITLRKNLAYSTLTGLAFLICLLATYLTGTRTALLALFVLLAIILLLSRKWLVALSLSAGLVVVLYYGLLGEASHLKAFLTRGGYGSWRPQTWMAAWQLGIEHFWFGTGMWENFQLEVIRDEVTTTVPHSHNFYLQLLNWTGVIGLSLYLSLLTIALRMTWRKLNKPLIFISAMILIYFLIVQIFDVYNVFTKPSYYWPCLWLPLGIIIGQTTKTNTPAHLNLSAPRSQS